MARGDKGGAQGNLSPPMQSYTRYRINRKLSLQQVIFGNQEGWVYCMLHIVDGVIIIDRRVYAYCAVVKTAAQQHQHQQQNGPRLYPGFSDFLRFEKIHPIHARHAAAAVHPKLFTDTAYAQQHRT